MIKYIFIFFFTFTLLFCHAQKGIHPAFPFLLPKDFVSDTFLLNNGNTEIYYWKDSTSMNENKLHIAYQNFTKEEVVINYVRNLDDYSYAITNDVNGNQLIRTVTFGDEIRIFYFDENGDLIFIGQYDGKTTKENGWHYTLKDGVITEKTFYKQCKAQK